QEKPQEAPAHVDRSLGIVGTIDAKPAKGDKKPYPPTPNSARLARLIESSGGDADEDISACGAIGGACSEIGPSADMTRSGGKVTITSVPMRSLDLSEKLPPCRSMRFLAIGRPRPAPCSADLIEFEPWPNEASTTGISSSGMPGPVSFTLMYCPPDAVQPTLSQISPPCGVNLMALERRLRQIWRTARSSAHSFGISGSNSSWMVRPRLPARSLSRWWQSSTA